MSTNEAADIINSIQYIFEPLEYMARKIDDNTDYEDTIEQPLSELVFMTRKAIKDEITSWVDKKETNK